MMLLFIQYFDLNVWFVFQTTVRHYPQKQMKNLDPLCDGYQSLSFGKFPNSCSLSWKLHSRPTVDNNSYIMFVNYEKNRRELKFESLSIKLFLNTPIGVGRCLLINVI